MDRMDMFAVVEIPVNSSKIRLYCLFVEAYAGTLFKIHRAEPDVSMILFLETCPTTSRLANQSIQLNSIQFPA